MSFKIFKLHKKVLHLLLLKSIAGMTKKEQLQQQTVMDKLQQVQQPYKFQLTKDLKFLMLCSGLIDLLQLASFKT